MMKLAQRLASIANELDAIGYNKEADAITGVLKTITARTGMTIDDILSELGYRKEHDNMWTNHTPAYHDTLTYQTDGTGGYWTLDRSSDENLEPQKFNTLHELLYYIRKNSY